MMKRIVEKRNDELRAGEKPVRPHGLWNTRSKTYYQLIRRFEDGR